MKFHMNSANKGICTTEADGSRGSAREKNKIVTNAPVSKR